MVRGGGRGRVACVFECKNNVRGGGWGAAEGEEGWRVCVKKFLICKNFLIKKFLCYLGFLFADISRLDVSGIKKLSELFRSESLFDMYGVVNPNSETLTLTLTLTA